MRQILAGLALLALTACASTESGGWTGQGAQPFDSAETECEAETLTDHGPVFNACMAEKGWTRTP